MKKKNGFTLIELLAVIVILAIIALIAIPVIMNILDKANKSALKDTAYGIINAGELYFSEQQLELDGMNEEVKFTFPTDEIDVKGTIPNGTELHVNAKGQTAIAMSNGRYCITKGYLDKDITITDQYEECYFPGTFGALATTSHECKAKGKKCIPGETLFTITLNPAGETQEFYVLADDGNTVTLIMNKNLGDYVPWYAGVNNNNYGPTTALTYLNSQTSEWEYIPAIKDYSYTDGGGKYQKVEIIDGKTAITAKDGTITNIEGITNARLLTKEEALSLKAANNNVLPKWLHTNLKIEEAVTARYWLLTANTDSDYRYYALTIDMNGGINNRSVSATDGRSGVRPVIVLSK